MTNTTAHDLDGRLLEKWQRGLPIVERPFRAMAKACDASESDVISSLAAMQENGMIARVGAVVRPNTIGASTLAALSVPDLEADETGELLASEPLINHVYLRENDWNFWFVTTGPDRASVDAVLARVARQTNRRVLDLRLERSYYIDLGFELSGPHKKHHVDPDSERVAATFERRDDDAELVQRLMTGLALVERPFDDLAEKLGREATDVLARIRELSEAGVLPRLGLIVRHRALGWRSNAMVVWDVPEDRIDAIGCELAKVPGVNLCYRRSRYETEWPFNLYCMIHAKSRDEALATLARATAATGLDRYPRQILFSLRCFKQTGARVVAPQPQEAA